MQSLLLLQATVQFLKIDINSDHSLMCGRNFFYIPLIKYDMLVFRFGKTRLKIDFSFAAIIAIYVYLSRYNYGDLCLYALLCHEIGHIIVITMIGVEIYEITLYGAGIRLGCDLKSQLERNKRLIYLAGCMMNFLLTIVSCCLKAYDFAAINAVMLIFNLLPIGEQDGALLMRSFLIKRFNIDVCERVTVIVQIVVCVILLVGSLCLFSSLSITLITTSLYLAVLIVSTYRK